MRDEFTEKTKRVLQDRSGNKCSNPDCHALTSGPNANPEKATRTGVAAHISAASKKGPRYNGSLTPEQRKSALNGIWLCDKCARFIDDDYLNYPESLLRDWKEEAEMIADNANKGRLAQLPHAPKVDDSLNIEEGWGCPFCGTTVPFGNSVCKGCNAELIPGLTRLERQDIAKTGLMLGGGIPLLIMVMLPQWLNSTFGWSLSVFFGFGVYGIVGIIFIAFVFHLFFINYYEGKRLQEPPRFFRSTLS
ncbi:MAG: hypothetical protein ACSHXJ_14275 [Marinomonas colpomeniae]